ncbi:Methyltransferase domain-containing protein [Seinonella peptonophila]|uniref:Methyltransferase domain-containing protein n=1 Tax=Seinonella peptonophila TaxID=112248 RepID=A0A1M4ZZX3_9BACL|nr:ParB N-terminal domain-containing protein [Seinonella peptonophila]SHF23196.1 Methyltransferase domain-containing protein [Seinonella peptonophila]
MSFVRHYPLNQITPADYNPRKITNDSFNQLKESLKRFGIVKPLILNERGVIIAGHQRLKAMKAIDMQESPAMVLSEVSLHDEIRFNLFHNSVETNVSIVFVNGLEDQDEGYHWVDPNRIHVVNNKNPSITYEICRVWGSVIVNDKGQVIANADYAVACKQLKEPLLVYKMNSNQIETLEKYLHSNYGSYHYDELKIPSYNQLHCQMHRLTARKKKNHSSTYEQYVLPILQRNHRLIDFGSGECAYIKKLVEQGYKAYGYEPYYRKKGSWIIDMKRVIKMIKAIEWSIEQKGLFDVVVLDGVLNSVVHLDFERWVMTACNSLLRKDGTFITGTRNLKSIKTNNKKKRLNRVRQIQFLDSNNFSGIFRDGIWTLQHFHDHTSLKRLCKRYFNQVEIFGAKSGANVYAVCKSPKLLPLNEYQEALNEEFNMVYPGGYRHNKHQRIVELIQKFAKERG